MGSNWYIYLVFGIVLILAGAFFFWKNMKLKESCTAQADGRIVSVVKKAVEVKKGEIKEFQNVFTPFYQFNVDGRDLTVKGTDVSKNRMTYLVGDRATIYYNPANPDKEYIVGKPSNVSFNGIICILLGIVVIVFGFVY